MNRIGSRSRALSVLAGLLFAATIFFAAGSFGQLAPEGESDGPEELPAKTQSEKHVVAHGAHLLAPPMDDFEPAVSSDEAIKVANASMPTTVGAATVEPVLTSYTALMHRELEEGYPPEEAPSHVVDRDAQVWVVTYESICVPTHGPAVVLKDGEVVDAEDGPLCGTNSQLNVVVDATTGEYVESFSYK